jgi:hypothetical protein
VLLAITKEQIVSANLLPLTELRQCFRYSGSVRSDGEIRKKHGWEELGFDWFHGKATIDGSDLRDLTVRVSAPARTTQNVRGATSFPRLGEVLSWLPRY